MQAHRQTAATLSAATLPAPEVPQPRGATPPCCDAAPPQRSVYLDAARALVPRWLRLIGPNPWLRACEQTTRRAPMGATQTAHAAQAALGLALVRTLDPTGASREHLDACIRATLLRWQLTLRGDGLPLKRGRADRAAQARACVAIIHLLTEAARFQTRELLTDVDHHLAWIARTPRLPPRYEGDVIRAMVEGAVLTRDARLLARARPRLAALLARQSPEGWFPENDGADAFAPSRLVEALARVRQITGWEELEKPLHRAVRFLLPFVRTDGRLAGTQGTCGAALASPLGIELLAPTMPEAATLAVTCRTSAERLPVEGCVGWTDEQVAAIGASIAQAALHAPPVVEGAVAPSQVPPGLTYFAQAGIAVIRTGRMHAVVAGRRGGAVVAVWPEVHAALDDPGIHVLFRRRTRTSALQAEGHGCTVIAEGLRAWGRLGPVPPERATHELGGGSTLATPGHTWLSPFHQLVASTVGRFAPHRRARDSFQREITFGEDWIRIRDVVDCHARCEAVVLQSAPSAGADPFSDADRPHVELSPPLFVPGGRRVEITRLYRSGQLADARSEPDAASHLSVAKPS